jgi:anti-sigma factor RsiW
MNACPGDDELLRYLDGELDAEAGARVVAHVEDCPGCQERLERLTLGRPTATRGDPIYTGRGAGAAGAAPRWSGRCGAGPRPV